MSSIAEFVIPVEEFVLGDVLSSASGLEVAIERLVVHTEGGLVPYIRVVGDDLSSFGDALEDDRTIADVRLIESFEGERLYRVHWVAETDALEAALNPIDASIVRAVAGERYWHLRGLFADREALASFYDACRAAYSIELDNVYDRRNPATFGEYEVTPEQRDLLVAAFEGGYFEVPRRITTQDLAEEFDISVQAVSQRLRRGHQNLLRNTLAAGVENEDVDDGGPTLDEHADVEGRDGMLDDTPE
ncbi:hypothetical protein AUR64_12140 [Haloprofundus marisrubri]|uniref:DNA-binding protein n=1 Tax=Haloprofundus marisrubri TaxID=1514971 RepID=A0A0W1RB47_9EURY|nr:helix-turn-helix domain-containing protein [Haloprofundus marisrubri]KTG10319.1 hypothetical protein AUR64_12140 [Haloprofundus marisrubri]